MNEKRTIKSGRNGRSTISRILDLSRSEGRDLLMEHESKAILESAGIRTTGATVVASGEEAVEAARNLTYPVVLKIVSPEVVHKTDAGGVKLNLGNDDDVRQAHRDILSSFSGKSITGVSVQRMAPPGVEAIVGFTRDDSFGPVLMFGLGGVFAEVLKDVTFRVLPITADSAREMMKEIKGFSILKGYRGVSVDLAALEEMLLGVSELAMKYPELKELDMNPVLLYPTGCVAADARIFIDHSPRISPEAPPGAKDDLHGLFYPESIAVLGATDSGGKLGYNVMRNLLSHQFAGKLYPINPRKASVLGIRAYPSILDVKDPVDTVIIIVPAGAAPQAIEDCCAKGVRHLVVETAGFAETGEAGRKTQARIKELVVKKGCRLLGPNCSGIINTHHNMVQSIGLVGELKRGNVGLIAQAGVYAAGMLTGLHNIMDFGMIATIGNKMDISEADILEFMGEDPNIRVVGMYMEDVTSGRRLTEVAGRVSPKKPVIALKTGRTEAGKKAVSSHTASMAGNDEINSAAFRQSGIIRARDNEHLFSLMRAFSKQPLPKGPGVFVVTYTGSLGVAATDMLYTRGLKLADLDTRSKDRLAPYLDDYLNVQNPLDCSFSMDASQARELIRIGVESPDVHAVIVIVQGEILGSYVEALASIDYRGKPVLCCVACKEFMMDHVIEMEQKGIPVYSTPEMAVEVLAEMYRHGRRRAAARLADLNGFLAARSFEIAGRKVHLRLLTQDDIDLWTDFVKSCSPRSLWMRFLSPFAPTPEAARRYCVLDPEEEVAVVAETVEGDSRKLVAIARLIKCGTTGQAEYAVIVTDSWQKKTLGRLLLEACLDLSRYLGVRVVNAEIVQENFPMNKVLNHCNFTMHAKERNMLLMSRSLE